MPNPLWVSKDGPEALSKELFTYARRLTEKDTFVVYVMAIPIAEAATANPTYGRKLIEFNEICKKKFGPQQFLDTTSFLPGNLTTDYSAPNNVTDEVLACAINRAVKCMLDKFVVSLVVLDVNVFRRMELKLWTSPRFRSLVLLLQ